MESLVISEFRIQDDPVEIVERKGLGHPDTICDALAECLSRDLCSEYRRRFGQVLHHNVDKALLCGGRATAAFGGGSVVAPVQVYLAGRAVADVGTQAIPLREIATESTRAWLRTQLHAFDAERHADIHVLIQPGSQDLQELFSRRTQGEVPLANDTSIGVGHAPLSSLERLVLEVERRINGRNRSVDRPAWGEDVKIMGVRNGNSVTLTVACAMIGRHLARLNDYLQAKSDLARLVHSVAAEHEFIDCNVQVNAADHVESGTVYLTVTGTSAEGGDDGQVGRGNRVNGLITPGRSMSLEAAAGKNPVSHVGKIYNVLAQQIADTVVHEISEIAAAQCLMVSRIGAPVTRPAILHIKVATRDGSEVARLKPCIADIATGRIARVPQLLDDFISGAIEVF